MSATSALPWAAAAPNPEKDKEGLPPEASIFYTAYFGQSTDKSTKPGGDANLTFGTPGTAGPGGAPGVNDGPEGVAQNELEVP